LKLVFFKFNTQIGRSKYYDPTGMTDHPDEGVVRVTLTYFKFLRPPSYL